AAQYPGIANVHLDAVEYDDQLVFMHAVKEGPASRSFGLHVAALAGVPKAVIADARKHLAALENGERRAAGSRPSEKESSPQLGLFELAQPSAVEDALREVDVDALTPRAAQDLLYRLKALL
ncbi:MAG: DNA mismatch repair protein MutS, partial [Proteobacteria bacterium]|nr:DNA mismatch repair protein MutS [Pseudomonadota bacterium]